jgi:hypothetical protein
MRSPVGHSVHCGETRSASGEQGNVVLSGGSADMCTIGTWTSTPRRVDDEDNLAAFNEIDCVLPVGLTDLCNHRSDVDAVSYQMICGTGGRSN